MKMQWALNKIRKLSYTPISVYIDKVLNDPEVQSKMIEMNQKQLYEDGLQADGTETGQYSPATKYHFKPMAEFQGRDGRTDHITLLDTGEFYDSMKVVVQGDSAVITGDTLKPDQDLSLRWPQALGLNETSKAEIRTLGSKIVRDAIRENFRA